MTRTGLALLALFATGVTLQADDWPQWLGPQRDGVWRETGLIEKFPSEGARVRWRTPIGAGYSGPAVVGGKVYVTDRVLAPGAKNSANPFGRDQVAGKERVLCLDEKTGKELWKHEYDVAYAISYPAGPRCTPVVAEGKVWTLGAMGDLFCFDASTGKVIWSKNFVKDFEATVPLWGFAAHPLLDGDKLITLVGGKDAVAVAFDKNTGKVLWKSLTAKEPGYCPPMIYTLGGKRTLVIWHPEAVNGLDPETGKVLWQEPWPLQSGLAIPTPRQQGDKLFLTAFYNGSMMIEVKPNKAEPDVVWKSKTWKGGTGSETPAKTDTLHSIMPTPFWIGDNIYGICSYGELRCLKAENGERVWMTLKATGKEEKPTVRWGNAFLVQNGDRFFIPNEQGDLIIAKLTPKGYEEISRAHILKPDNAMARGRLVNWSHPAFANKSMYARNDSEIVCVDLAGK